MTIAKQLLQYVLYIMILRQKKMLTIMLINLLFSFDNFPPQLLSPTYNNAKDLNLIRYFNKNENIRNLNPIISEFRNKINNNSRILEISDLKSLASSGGSLSTYEMDAILDSGGLSKLSIEENKKNFSIPTNNRKNKKKKRKLGVSRVGGRKGSLASKRDD